METVGREIRPPDIWRHHRSGELSCAYEGGETVFTWPPEAVAEMARRWRDSDSSVPEQAQLFHDAHGRLEVMFREAGLRPPDRMVFHIGRRALRGVWEEEKVVLEIDGIGAGVSEVRPGT